MIGFPSSCDTRVSLSPSSLYAAELRVVNEISQDPPGYFRQRSAGYLQGLLLSLREEESPHLQVIRDSRMPRHASHPFIQSTDFSSTDNQYHRSNKSYWKFVDRDSAYSTSFPLNSYTCTHTSVQATTILKAAIPSKDHNRIATHNRGYNHLGLFFTFLFPLLCSSPDPFPFCKTHGN